jgi:DNA-binding MarR family transcriptional regulator
VSSSEVRVTDGSPYRLSYLVKELQEALLARLDEITREFGLTAKQYTALSILARTPGMSSAALGRHTFVTPQAAHEMVTTLERKGFLERSVDRDNRRRLEVSLTRRGRAALILCDERVDALEASVFGGLGRDGRARFRHTLEATLYAAGARRVPG